MRKSSLPTKMDLILPSGWRIAKAEAEVKYSSKISANQKYRPVRFYVFV